jgi:hypothetical protein
MVRKFMVLVGLAAFLFTGCSTTSQLTSPLDANLAVGNSPATLVLRSGQTFEARQIQFDSDSSRFINQSDDRTMTISSLDLAAVHVLRHTQGAAEGLILGGLGGLSVSYIATSVALNPGDPDMRWLLVAGGALLGGAGGFTVGAIKGHDYVFTFPLDTLHTEKQIEIPARSRQ